MVGNCSRTPPHLLKNYTKRDFSLVLKFETFVSRILKPKNNNEPLS